MLKVWDVWLYELFTKFVFAYPVDKEPVDKEKIEVWMIRRLQTKCRACSSLTGSFINFFRLTVLLRGFGALRRIASSSQQLSCKCNKRSSNVLIFVNLFSVLHVSRKWSFLINFSCGLTHVCSQENVKRYYILRTVITKETQLTVDVRESACIGKKKTDFFSSFARALLLTKSCQKPKFKLFVVRILMPYPILDILKNILLHWVID